MYRGNIGQQQTESANRNIRLQNHPPVQAVQRCSQGQAGDDILLRQRHGRQRKGKVPIHLQCPFAAFPRESSVRIPDTVGLSAFLPCMTRAGVAAPYP